MIPACDCRAAIPNPAGPRAPVLPPADDRRRVLPSLAFCLLLACTLGLGGCASVSRFDGIPLESDTLYVANVPALRQTPAIACGPTCVAAVAATFGVSPADLRRDGVPLSGNASAGDLVSLAETLGLRGYAYESSLAELETHLRRGRAVIVMIPQSIVPTGGLVGHVVSEAWNAVGPKPAHWVVVVGVQPDGDLILHDPAAGPVVMNRGAFARHWRATRQLTVLVAAR